MALILLLPAQAGADGAWKVLLDSHHKLMRLFVSALLLPSLLLAQEAKPLRTTLSKELVSSLKSHPALTYARYPIQASRYLTGKVPTSVRGLPSTRHRDLFPEGVEETMSFELLFDDGFQALCRASYGNNFHQCTTLGPKGIVEILPGQPAGSVYGQSGGGRPNAKRHVVNKKEIACEDTLHLGVLLDELAKAIKEKQPFKCSGEMGLRDIRIVESIYQSAKQGGAQVELKV